MRMHIRPTLYPILVCLSIMFTCLLAGVSHPFLWALASTFGLMGLFNIRKPALIVYLTEVDAGDEELYDEDEL